MFRILGSFEFRIYLGGLGFREFEFRIYPEGLGFREFEFRISQFSISLKGAGVGVAAVVPAGTPAGFASRFD